MFGERRDYLGGPDVYSGASFGYQFDYAGETSGWRSHKRIPAIRVILLLLRNTDTFAEIVEEMAMSVAAKCLCHPR